MPRLIIGSNYCSGSVRLKTIVTGTVFDKVLKRVYIYIYMYSSIQSITAFCTLLPNSSIHSGRSNRLDLSVSGISLFALTDYRRRGLRLGRFFCRVSDQDISFDTFAGSPNVVSHFDRPVELIHNSKL